ncbi:MAG TPA: hypothetical protein VID29_04505 [Solirubrobacteraceae bacterium]|jgi:hypothetical protein
MSGARLTALLGTVLVFGAAFASAAQGDTEARIAPSFSPDRLGAGTAVTLSAHFASTQGVPAPLHAITVHLPAGLAVNLSGLGICPRARLAARGPRGCPSSSLVGRGSALLEGQLGVLAIPESATLTAFRGPNRNGNPTLEISGHGLSPLDVRVTFSGVLEPDRAPYGRKLVMAIPAIATLPTEPDASTSRFSLTIGGAAAPHARGAIRVPGSCPSGGFPFAASFAFADGTGSEASAAVACP